MKRNLFKRIISALIAVVMVLSLCSCGNREASANAEANNEAAKQHVFSYADVDLGIDFNNVGIMGMDYVNDRVYAVIQDYSGNYSAAGGARAVIMPSIGVEEGVVEEGAVEEFVYSGPTYLLVSAKLDGSDKKESVLDMGEGDNQNSYMNRVLFREDGNVFGVLESYVEDYSDPSNPLFLTKNYLFRWDAEGTLVWRKDISEYVGEVEYYYPRDMFIMEDGSIAFFSYEGLGANVDENGNMIAKIEMDPDQASHMGNIFRKNDGTIYMTSYNDEYTKMFINTLDVRTGVQGEKTELPGNIMNYTFYQGASSDFTLVDNKGVYAYNIGDEEPVKIMDYINSDLPTTYLSNIVIIDADHLLASYNDQSDWNMHVSYMTKVDPKDVPDKKAIVLGCFYLDYNVRKRVIDFNKSNTEYRITVKDYSSYSTMEDYSAGYTKFNNDVISGQIPDIIIANSEMDVNNYINKGILADISEMIANDEELSKVELIPNVVEALSVDGKMYTLVPSFSIRSLVGKTSVLGDRTQWNMAEFMDFAASLPEGTTAFNPEMLRDSFLYEVMNFLGSDFVDPVTGKCNFDSAEFISLLEYAKTLPAELSEDYWMNYDYSLYETMYRENKAILMEVYMSSISDLKYQLKGQMGEEVTFIGFPTEEGNGSVIMLSSNAFAISAKSANKDGAWEFIRYYLTEEYQKSGEFYEFPIVKSAFEEKAKEATGKSYWIDENGEKVEYDDYYYMGGEEIILEPFTQEEVDEICEFIYSVKKVNKFDNNIRNIINEEAQSFFEGQKSAQEVAQIIQSRAQIFVDENR